jgi:tetratricopeptide (TPR) repeat protein
VGRYEEAITETDRALAMDPISAIRLNNRAMILFRARRYAEAIGPAQSALEMDPNLVNSLWWLGMSYAGQKEWAHSIETLDKARVLSPQPMFAALMAHVEARSGNRPRALELLKEIEAAAGKQYVSPMDFAIVYAGLGDKEKTFEWLNRAAEAHAARMHELPAMYFDGIRNDPRYGALMKHVGLTI